MCRKYINARKLSLTGNRNSDRSNIYEACEIISDGYVTCTKYAGGTIWLPEMHIVVLSNFGPIGGKLSEDRLEILTVINGELIKENAVDQLQPFAGYSV